eukprot:evm.model.NODE_6314_length_7751_cov_40.754353.2
MGIDLHLPLPDLPPNMLWGGMMKAYFANADALTELAASARSAGVSRQTIWEVVLLLVLSAITYYSSSNNNSKSYTSKSRKSKNLPTLLSARSPSLPP